MILMTYTHAQLRIDFNSTTGDTVLNLYLRYPEDKYTYLETKMGNLKKGPIVFEIRQPDHIHGPDMFILTLVLNDALLRFTAELYTHGQTYGTLDEIPLRSHRYRDN